jgi:hypothetical protein
VQRQQALQFNVPNGKLWKFHMRLWLFQRLFGVQTRGSVCNATSVGVVFA